jgi:acetyl-CoA C-acetyltransferase
VYETVLSGDLLGDDGQGFANNKENSYHIVTGSGTNDTAALDGFTITAGNACALCDAAAAQVLMGRDKADALGLEPMALIRGYSFVGYEPKKFGVSPVKAIPAALKLAGLELSDIDLIELNEAFAAQYLACERELKIDRSKVNVHGGAIALGHPVAATGSKILTTLLYAMKDRDAQLGLVSACIGGGNGVALVVERLN